MPLIYSIGPCQVITIIIIIYYNRSIVERFQLFFVCLFIRLFTRVLELVTLFNQFILGYSTTVYHTSTSLSGDSTVPVLWHNNYHIAYTVRYLQSTCKSQLVAANCTCTPLMINHHFFALHRTVFYILYTR